MLRQAPGPLSRELLLEYFLGGATPRDQWKVGMELEKLGRRREGGGPIPYNGEQASVRAVLEFIQKRRGGRPVYEAHNMIGLDAPWGSLSLEPGGQVEWSSRPHATLSELAAELDAHLAIMAEAGEALGVRWLDTAVDPDLPVTEMIWMPKARYKIMRSFLGERGRLAHRMMTQTASIQCAFDYGSAEDWKRKFLVAAKLAPLATALFANSSRLDGSASGYRNYRAMIWRETDDERCGLPAIVFDADFDIERWLDWILSVPTIFRHRSRGLVPSGAIPFAELVELTGCDAIRIEDWETHASTIFTEVRSYTYIEVRSADLQPDERAFAVPSLWTGLLYDDDALEAAVELAAIFDSHERWSRAMEAAARHGLDADSDGVRLEPLARRALTAAAAGLAAGAACVGDPARALEALDRLAQHHGIVLPA